MGVNSLPKTVTRQRRDCDSNPCSSEPESSTPTTRLPSHREYEPSFRQCNVTKIEELRRTCVASCVLQCLIVALH